VPAAAQQNQAKHDANGSGLSSYAQANVGLRGAMFDTRAHFKPMARPAAGPFAVAPTPSTSDADIAAVKRVIEAARKGREAEANATQASISDPVARKLAEWIILRSDNTNPSFQRYAAWVEANIPETLRKLIQSKDHFCVQAFFFLYDLLHFFISEAMV